MRATAGRRCMLRSIQSGILNSRSAVWLVGSALVPDPAIESGLGGNMSSGLTSTIDHYCQLRRYGKTYVYTRNDDFDRHGEKQENSLDAPQNCNQQC